MENPIADVSLERSLSLLRQPGYRADGGRWQEDGRCSLRNPESHRGRTEGRGICAESRGLPPQVRSVRSWSASVCSSESRCSFRREYAEVCLCYAEVGDTRTVLTDTSTLPIAAVCRRNISLSSLLNEPRYFRLSFSFHIKIQNFSIIRTSAPLAIVCGLLSVRRGSAELLSPREDRRPLCR